MVKADAKHGAILLFNHDVAGARPVIVFEGPTK